MAARAHIVASFRSIRTWHYFVVLRLKSGEDGTRSLRGLAPIEWAAPYNGCGPRQHGPHLVTVVARQPASIRGQSKLSVYCQRWRSLLLILRCCARRFFLRTHPVASCSERPLSSCVMRFRFWKPAHGSGLLSAIAALQSWTKVTRTSKQTPLAVTAASFPLGPRDDMRDRAFAFFVPTLIATV